MTESWRAKMPPRHLGRVLAHDLCCHEGDVEDLITRANAELDTKDARIAELEARLSALTTRQPMEKAPRDGTWVLLVTNYAPSISRTLRRQWRDNLGGVTEPRDCLGWYALPEEVSRG
jgi:hypothetical protein